MGRPARVAAAMAVGGVLLVPATLASVGPAGFFPVASSSASPGAVPSAGDLLAALRRLNSSPEEYGASGNLPESDTLSAELLAALGGPGGLGLDTGAGAQATVPPGPLGIPGVLLQAYLNAQQRTDTAKPGCGVTWSVLAAIGRIESNHARGGAVDAAGTTIRPILGPQLSGGPGIAAIRDTDGGLLDGDTVWDRAVGPMQFIPGTWRGFASDGNDDGTASPHNIYDATLASANYLCSGGEDLRNPQALARAIFRYNHSDAYVANVLTWAAAYANGVTPLPSSPGPIDDPGDTPPGNSNPNPTDPKPSPTQTPTPTTTTTTPTTTTPTCLTTTTPTSPSSTTPTTPTSTTPPPAGCETTTPPPSSTTTGPTPTSSIQSTTTGTGSQAPSSDTGPTSAPEATTAPEGTTTDAGTTTDGTSTTGDAAGSATTTTSLPPA
ncbi:MAG TPA: lytic murein transglycosylase [Pseudonocardiaceae bacterium]